MGIKVEVFSSPGCSRCSHAKSVLQKLVEEMGADAIQWREVNILDELDYAVELGVRATPGIAIDGRLMFTAQPSREKLRAAILKANDR